MPITQDRLVALIQAARDYQHAFAELRKTVIQQERNVRAGRASPAEALDYIIGLTDREDAFLLRPIETTRAIEVEHDHFRSHGRDNRRAAKRAEERRRRQGVPSRHPASLDDLSTASVQLDWDSTDPENAFNNSSLSDALGLDAPAPDSTLPFSHNPGLDRRIQLEMAPEGHSSQVRAGATFEEDLLICQCGFEGHFAEWKEHLTAQEDQP